MAHRRNTERSRIHNLLPRSELTEQLGLPNEYWPDDPLRRRSSSSEDSTKLVVPRLRRTTLEKCGVHPVPALQIPLPCQLFESENRAAGHLRENPNRLSVSPYVHVRREEQVLRRR